MQLGKTIRRSIYCIKSAVSTQMLLHY